VRNILTRNIERTPSSSSDVLQSDLKWTRVRHTLGTKRQNTGSIPQRDAIELA